MHLYHSNPHFQPPTIKLQALRYEKGSAILSTGALAAFSGAKTGRSPLDKRVVEESGEPSVWGRVKLGLGAAVRGIRWMISLYDIYIMI